MKSLMSLMFLLLALGVAPSASAQTFVPASGVTFDSGDNRYETSVVAPSSGSDVPRTLGTWYGTHAQLVELVIAYDGSPPADVTRSLGPIVLVGGTQYKRVAGFYVGPDVVVSEVNGMMHFPQCCLSAVEIDYHVAIL